MIRESGKSMDAQMFKEIFATHAAGVAIVTFDARGYVHGLTVTTLTPVSVSPPLALFCVASGSGSRQHLEVGMMLGFSILTHAQRDISQRFSRSVDLGGYKDIEVTRGEFGVPVLTEAISTVEAKIVCTYPGGDHVIYLCALKSARVMAEIRPLVYVSRGYHRLAPIETTSSEVLERSKHKSPDVRSIAAFTEAVLPEKI
jgi:flavin reductase (DIM6/NTAB) family NADH-FMN oxidoreductase RutF